MLPQETDPSPGGCNTSAPQELVAAPRDSASRAARNISSSFSATGRSTARATSRRCPRWSGWRIGQLRLDTPTGRYSNGTPSSCSVGRPSGAGGEDLRPPPDLACRKSWSRPEVGGLHRPAACRVAHELVGVRRVRPGQVGGQLLQHTVGHPNITTHLGKRSNGTGSSAAKSPGGGTAYVPLGTLPYSGRSRGVICPATDQAHLVEAMDGVLRRLGGTARYWRVDRNDQRRGAHYRRPATSPVTASRTPRMTAHPVGRSGTPHRRPRAPGVTAKKRTLQNGRPTIAPSDLG